jgi:hypothetical protein
VPEADHVHRHVRKRGDAAADRGAARAVAVHQPDADAAQRDDLAPTEAPHEGGRVVVAGDRLEGRHLLEQARHLGSREISEMQDPLDPRPRQAALELRGETITEAGQVRVRHHPDVHAGVRFAISPSPQRRVTFAATHTQRPPRFAHTSV